MKTVSVVVPVYYNEGSLPLLFAELQQVERTLLEKQVQLELIFVDDGSGDGSWQQLLAIKAQRAATKLIKLTRNFGAIHACKTGARFVTGDCFTLLAADLQDPPELIQAMVDKWLAGAKYVVCARQGRDDPLRAKIFSYFYYRLVRFFVAADYPSEGYDLCLMDKVILPYFQASGKNAYTPLFIYWLGFRPEIIFYRRRERTHGKSRWTFWKKFNAVIDSLAGFSIVPIRLVSLIGFVVSFVSLGYGSVILVNGILGRIEVRGFATVVTLMTFLLGVIIIMLGMIGEYIWRIFDEVNKRPEAVIDEIR
jgi:glycosyltransferase involved in cell wall biosynthesis